MSTLVLIACETQTGNRVKCIISGANCYFLSCSVSGAGSVQLVIFIYFGCLQCICSYTQLHWVWSSDLGAAAQASEAFATVAVVRKDAAASVQAALLTHG